MLREPSAALNNEIHRVSREKDSYQDHKPLVPLQGSKSLDELPPRIQRVHMMLMRFSFTISHVAGKDNATADVLSRAPVSNVVEERKGNQPVC